MPTKHTIAQSKYDSKNCKMYGFKLNYKYDADIMAKLTSVSSMQGYIKQLIRADIAGDGIGKSDKKTDCASYQANNRGKQLEESVSIATEEKLETDREVFRLNLNELMRITKVKQVDVAQYVGVSYQTVSAWALGRSYPRADAMEKLCKFFGVSLSVLTEQHGKSSTQEDELLKLFRGLSQQGREKAIERTEELTKLYPKKDDI